MADIQDLFKETIAEFMEDSLDAELTEELGYSKYDYKNKGTENSRNEHSSKKLRTSYGAVDESSALDALGTFGQRWDKKYPKSNVTEQATITKRATQEKNRYLTWLLSDAPEIDLAQPDVV